MKIRIFIAHLTKINTTELPMLPPYAVTNSLCDDEMIEIIMYAIPNSWNKKLREQGKDPVLTTKDAFFKAARIAAYCPLPREKALLFLFLFSCRGKE